MELKDLRVQIDEIDKSMVELFTRRMEVCKEIALCKQGSGKKVYDPERERRKLAEIAELSGEAMRSYTVPLYSLMMDLSKTWQDQVIGGEKELSGKIRDALAHTDPVFPGFATVACQGIEGAYSQMACDRLFATPNIMYFKNFDAVFTAIEKGLCQYGVLPIENSTAGSVNAVYDRMMQHKFSIVRSVRVKVDHSLLAPEGVSIGDIREIVSHEQALQQCSGFIKSLDNVKVTVCENTAEAAKLVAQSGRRDLAALSSRNCAAIYGLACLQEAVQDKGSNFTRFICISKDLEIYPGADKTSIMAVTAHRPGALYKLLSRFFAAGVNLTKLESRPLPDKDFEFMFYFDLEKSIYCEEFVRLLGELDEMCERFEYLGSYTELV